MAQKDSKNILLEKNALNTQVINTDTTTNGVIIDTLGYESVLFILKMGIVTAGNATILIQDGDDASLSDAANVDDKWLLGTEVTLDASNALASIGYIGKKRYVRLSVITAGTADLTAGAICMLGDAIVNPTV
jgi:hypothetical protein